MDTNSNAPEIADDVDRLDDDIPRLIDRVASDTNAVEVLEGILWLRLTLDGALDHVNVYLLEEPRGWTLVDTGTNTPACRIAFEKLLRSEQLKSKPITRVLVTHYHPDHVGLAGWFAAKGIPLWCTRTCWLSATLLQQAPLSPTAAQLEILRKSGVSSIELEAYARRKPNERFSSTVHKMPLSYRALQANETVKIGNRIWKTIVFDGHAAGHATFWSDDGVAILGDLVLQGISPSLVLHGSEPEADLVAEFLDACKTIESLGTPTTICLPGHNVPFAGLSARCRQMISSHLSVLSRLLDFLARPRLTIDCIATVLPPSHRAETRDVQILKTAVYLNHLSRAGLVECLELDGKYLWSRKATTNV